MRFAKDDTFYDCVSKKNIISCERDIGNLIESIQPKKLFLVFWWNNE